jgi:hypothetical protein
MGCGRRKKGIKSIPGDMLDFKEGCPFWYINEMLKALPHRNMIVIDPLREFSARNLNKKEVHRGSYPNRKANAIIADYIVRKLKKEFD